MSRAKRVPPRGGHPAALPRHRKLSKDEQWGSLLLALTYLGQLTLDQMSRLLLTPTRTLQRRLTQDADSLSKQGFITRLDQADFDAATARTERARSYWQVTPDGVDYLKHHAQFPTNVLGQNAQYPARLNTIRKGTTQHDRWVAEAIICLIEHARERLGGLSGIFIRFEMKLNPARPAPIADAVVVIHAEPDPREPCHPLPFTRDRPTAGDYYGTFVFEIDMGTEPRSTIQGKAVSYQVMLTDPRWQQPWVERFGPRLFLLWIVPDERRRDTIRDLWRAQLPDIRFYLTTFAEVQQNAWQRYSHGRIDEVLLFPRPPRALPEPAAPEQRPATPEQRPATPEQRPATPEQRPALPPPSAPPSQVVLRSPPPGAPGATDITPNPRSIARPAQRATSIYDSDERIQQQQQRCTVEVQVVERITGHPLSGVTVLLGTGECVQHTTRTNDRGIARGRLPDPLDLPVVAAQWWWSVPDARQRQSLADAVVGEPIRVEMEAPAPPTHPPTLAERLPRVALRGVLGVGDTLVAAASHVVASGIAANQYGWSHPAWWTGWFQTGIVVLCYGSLGVLVGAAQGARLLVVLLLVVAWGVGEGVLRLVGEALVVPWEQRQWQRYLQQEEQAWRRYQQAHAPADPPPSRAAFDQARQAYRPVRSPRGRPRRAMGVMALLLLVVSGGWVLLHLGSADPLMTWWVSQRSPAPPLVAPTPLEPSPSPRPPPTWCWQGRVTSVALNVRNAPYGTVVAQVSQGTVVTLPCTPSVEREGVWWVEIVPPPGVEGPTWVARAFLERVTSPLEENP